MSLRKEYGVTEVESINILNHKRTNIEACFIYGKYDKELSEIGEQGMKLWEIDFIYGLLND